MRHISRSRTGRHDYGRARNTAGVRRILLWCALVIGVGVVISFSLWVKQRRGTLMRVRQSVDAPPLPQEEFTEYIPPFKAATFEGKPFAIASYEGKQGVVVDFWASWCAPCAIDMPRLVTAAGQYGENAIAVVGIHRGDTESAEKGIAFAAKIGSTHIFVQDPDGSLFKLLGQGKPFMPLTLFIDREGKVVDRRFGPKTEEEIRVSMAKIITP